MDLFADDMTTSPSPTSVANHTNARTRTATMALRPAQRRSTHIARDALIASLDDPEIDLVRPTMPMLTTSIPPARRMLGTRAVAVDAPGMLARDRAAARSDRRPDDVPMT